MSAALVVASLAPWSVAQQAASVYHNPWAYRPCVDELPELPRSIPSSDARVERQAGIAPHTLFGLPEDWPAD